MQRNENMVEVQLLNPRETITSNNGRYKLVYQHDGNLVIYRGIYKESPRKEIWETNTSGLPIGYVAMQSDGNFVIRNYNTILWASNTYKFNAKLYLRDDGILVIYDQNNYPIWQSDAEKSRLLYNYIPENTPPAPPPSAENIVEIQRLNAGEFIMSRNGRYRLDFQNNGNLVVYKEPGLKATWMELWASGTNGFPVGYVVMQNDGNLVICNGNTILWTSNTYGNNTRGNVGAKLYLQNDGDLVIYDNSGQLQWAASQSKGVINNFGQLPPIYSASLSDFTRNRMLTF